MAVMHVKVMFFLEIGLLPTKTLENGTKIVESGSQMDPRTALEPRTETRAFPVFPLTPPGPAFGQFWGQPDNPKSAPGEPLGRQRGSKTQS